MRSIYFMISHMLLLSFFFTSSVFAQQKYEVVIDTEGRSGFSDSKEDLNGNMILCGGERKLPYFTNVFGIVVKVLPDGDTLVRTFDFGNDTMSYLGQIIVTPDNNYLLFGGIGKEDSVHQFKDMNYLWVLKLDENLDVIWDKRYKLAGDYWNPGFKVFQSNENIYMAGNLDWWDGYYRVNFFMAKFNMEGDTIKTHYPFIDNPMQFPLGQLEGGTMGRHNGQEGMMIVGAGFSAYYEESIIEIDPDLNYTSTELSYPSNMTLMTPGTKRLTETSYLWVSNEHTYNQGNSDMMIAKFNQNHNMVDHYIYGRTDTIDFPALGKCIDFVNPDNIFVASMNNHFTSDPVDLKVSIALLDAELNMKGWKWYGGDMNYTIFTISATNDDGCVIGGTVCDWQNNQEGDVDLWVKKIYAEDLITHAEDTPDPNDSDVAIFPNPGSDYLGIKTIRKNLVLKLYTINGLPVTEKNINEYPVFKLNTSGIKKGNYLYQIFDTNKKIVIESGTWIKTK